MHAFFGAKFVVFCSEALICVERHRALATLTWRTEVDMHTSYRYSSTSSYLTGFQ